jgi:hypothetical protein
VAGGEPEVELPPDAPVHEEYWERDGFTRGDAACWWLRQQEGAGLLTRGQDDVRKDLFQGLVVLVGLDLDALHVGCGEQGAEPLPGLLVFLPDPGAGSDVLVLRRGAGCRSCSRLGVRRERRSSMTGEMVFHPGVMLAQAAR